MHIDWLYAFISTVETGSFSKASEKRSLSQPALSKQIRSLEEALNVTLFNRASHGVTLTEAGQHTHRRIETMIQQWEALQDELQHLHERQKLTVGCLPSLALYYLPNKLVSHTSPVPIELQVRTHSADLIQDVVKGRIDMALSEFQGEPTSLYAIPLFTETLCVVVSEHHRLSTLTEIGFEDIKDEQWVVRPIGCDIRLLIQRLFDNHGEKMVVSFETDSEEGILGFVTAGAGITILPHSQVKLMNSSSLRGIPLTEPEACRHIHLVARTKKTGKQICEWLQLT